MTSSRCIYWILATGYWQLLCKRDERHKAGAFDRLSNVFLVVQAHTRVVTGLDALHEIDERADRHVILIIDVRHLMSTKRAAAFTGSELLISGENDSFRHLSLEFRN